jgi:Zn-dependent peptidase ImmA (M78 family)
MTDDNPGQMARLAARQELKSRNIESLDEIDVETIALFHRLFVVEGELEGAEGRSVTHAGAGIIRIRADIKQVERRRFIIAHELGHCILHKTGSVKPCTEGDLFRYEAGNREAEANWFASELLMPGRLLAPHCDVPQPSFAAIKRVAAACRTTLTATSIRFAQLTSERCCVVWSEGGKVKWAVRSPDSPAWVERERALSPLSHASDIFRGKPVPTGFQRVPQNAWFDQRVLGGCDVLEETLSFPRLRAALTMLWLPQAPDEDDRESDDDDDDPRWRR